MGRTHLALGLLIGLALLPVFKPAHPILFVIIVTLASLLPDIDEENSTVNKKLPTRWIAKLVKHRGVFHTIWPALILYFVLHYFKLDLLGIPLAIGYLAHLAGDCVTRQGCNLLHPVSTLRIQGFLHTGSATELIVLGGILIIDAVLIFKQVF